MIHRPSEYRKDPAIAWNYYHMPAPPVNPPPPNTTTRDLIATKKMAGRLLRQPAMNPLDEDHTTPEASPSTLPIETPEKPRGRKRVRAPAHPVATGASNTLILFHVGKGCLELE
ncbi:hypothetical protein B0H13DRAFT_1867399 [Mycena leptocephala]|nr:hypothetical protein B0H13DRAFT_1867399 [Mycena leptocephala]